MRIGSMPNSRRWVVLGSVVFVGLSLHAPARGALITFADQPDVRGTGQMPRPYYDDTSGLEDWPAGVRADFEGFNLTEEWGYGADDTKSVFGAADFGSGSPAEITFSSAVKVPRFYVYNLLGESEPYDGSFRVEGYLAAEGPDPVFSYAYTEGFSDQFIEFNTTTYPLLDRAIDRIAFFQFDMMNLDSVTVIGVPEPASAVIPLVAAALACHRRGRARR